MISRLPVAVASWRKEAPCSSRGVTKTWKALDPAGHPSGIAEADGIGEVPQFDPQQSASFRGGIRWPSRRESAS